MPESDEVFYFQCPKCSKRLRAGSSIIGKRVKCPGCQEAVRVPGVVEPVANADDQWLSLDAPAISDVAARKKAAEAVRDTKQAERQKSRTKSPSSRASRDNVPHSTASRDSKAENRHAKNDDAVVAGAPDINVAKSSDEEPALVAEGTHQARRSIFDDDLPALAELEPTSRPSRSDEQVLAAHVANSDPMDLDSLIPDMPGASAPPVTPLYVEDDSSADPEYRITCKTCGTYQYVKLSTKGMKIKCPDCHSEFRVPGPPPGWSPSKKKKARSLDSEPDVALAPPEELQHQQTVEAQRLRAQKLLERAASDVSEEEIDRLYDGDFDTAGFVQRTFGFARDPIMLSQIFGYGVVFAIIFAMVQFAILSANTEYGMATLLMTMIGGPLITMLFAMPMLSGGLALIESVANRQTRVSEWPGFNLFDNIGDIIAISVALVAAILPGFFLGAWIGSGFMAGGRIQITAMMITAFALFPIFLLSMLDNGSIFQPISQSIMRSLTEAKEAWGGYFLKTMIAFFMTAIAWYLLLGKSPILSGLAGFLLPLLVFFTCQQIGALADGISDHLSFEFVDKSDEKQDEVAAG
ncbi:MAG: hypothetical protein KDB22_13505 [Planctomycetales bacterium]|nr:hypothetical protein [Planctomycetales bacterium]